MWILPPLNASSKRNGAIYKATFPFTNHRISLQVFRQRRSKIDQDCERWFSMQTLESVPIPSPHRRAILDLLPSALDACRAVGLPKTAWALNVGRFLRHASNANRS
jgi:hypothetical protein